MGKTVDYIVIGQGLCGTLLSRQLLAAGKSILVVDVSKPSTASKVASGVINPVTGRRIVRTWRIEELLPFAWKEYQDFGKELGVPMVSQCNILDFHATRQMQEAFEKRMTEEGEYLHAVEDEKHWRQYLNFNYGVNTIAPCLLVDMNAMLSGWRRHLKATGSLLEEEFAWADCHVFEDHVIYKDDKAEKIICCEGVDGFGNIFFKNLPYTHMKGEALLVKIAGLPRQNIYKQGLNIVAWQDDLFWVGSTYEWSFTDTSPTPAWRKRAEEQLRYWLKLPFETVDHLASVRPANVERRPFVGLHPRHQSVGVFNGMGAKGCSLAPFFAWQLTQHLVYGAPLYADANVARFKKILERS